MLRFTQYLEESVSLTDLKKKYDKFNRLAFDNKLRSSSHIDWKISKRLKNATALTHTKFFPGTDRKIKSIGITFSTVVNLPDEEIDKVLVHEMIHVNFMETRNFKAGHGIFFKSMALAVGAKLGMVVPLTHDISEMDIDLDNFSGKEAGIVLWKQPDNKYFGMAFNADALEKQLLKALRDRLADAVIRQPPGQEFHFIIASHPMSQRFTLKRKLPKRLNFTLVSKKEAEEVIKTGRTIDTIP
jgi:hypothetical protein